MRALITGMRRSGSMWLAAALRECGGIDARHESVKDVRKIQHVEVNTYMAWNVNAGLWPKDLLVILLARDGRDVVRSAMERGHNRVFERWCWEWTARNGYLVTQIPPARRFRFEDLTGSSESFDKLATLLGFNYKLAHWEQMRFRRINAGAGTYPPWSQWSREQTAAFWGIAGNMMATLGYRR